MWNTPAYLVYIFNDKPFQILSSAFETCTYLSIRLVSIDSRRSKCVLLYFLSCVLDERTYSEKFSLSAKVYAKVFSVRIECNDMILKGITQSAISVNIDLICTVFCSYWNRKD